MALLDLQPSGDIASEITSRYQEVLFDTKMAEIEAEAQSRQISSLQKQVAEKKKVLSRLTNAYLGEVKYQAKELI